jgi:hypothetical protein
MSKQWMVLGAALAVVGAASPAARSQRTEGGPAPRRELRSAARITPPEGAPEAGLARARVGGKYAGLLRRIRVPADAQLYGEFSDWGRWEGTEWAGFTDLSPGYWVYVAPDWFIWRELVPARSEKRDWGPEQATGAPDTREAGDIVTAWASLTPDDQEEWLLLEFAGPVVPAALLIHETFNPGAVRKVSLFDAAGKEVEVWKGTDPAAGGASRGLAVILLAPEFATSRVRVTLDSAAVPGWNEIDAVGLVDSFGDTHWATAATASSTYAEQQPAQLFE